MKYFKSPFFWLTALLPFTLTTVYASIGPIIWPFWENVPDHYEIVLLVAYATLCIGAIIFFALKKIR